MVQDTKDELEIFGFLKLPYWLKEVIEEEKENPYYFRQRFLDHYTKKICDCELKHHCNCWPRQQTTVMLGVIIRRIKLLYEKHITIKERLSKVKQPRPSNTLKKKIFDLFMLIQAPYDKHKHLLDTKKSKRHNIINLNYFLAQSLRLFKRYSRVCTHSNLFSFEFTTNMIALKGKSI